MFIYNDSNIYYSFSPSFYNLNILQILYKIVFNHFTIKNDLFIQEEIRYEKVIYFNSFCCFVLFLVNIWKCFEFIPCFLLREHFWLCLEKNVGCLGLKRVSHMASKCTDCCTFALAPLLKS